MKKSDSKRVPPPEVRCPRCGEIIRNYRNPLPAVDVVISLGGKGIVLIRRKNPPLGWALPGGFIEYGETAEEAGRREALEETGLRVELEGLVGVYSDPGRDPRRHVMSVVFAANARGVPKAGDDAAGVKVFPEGKFPPDLAFDHERILSDYMEWKAGKSLGTV